jgi:hypothetical protein
MFLVRSPTTRRIVDVGNGDVDRLVPDERPQSSPDLRSDGVGRRGPTAPDLDPDSCLIDRYPR